MINWEEVIYFDSHEFDSPDEIGSGEKMNIDFIEKLDKARECAGTSFNVTSGYRTVKHNRKVGGVGNSSHLLGLAADIKAETNLKKIRIVIGAIRAGIHRIGISQNFIHLDTDPNKIESLWLYPAPRGVISSLINFFYTPEDI